MEKKLRTPFKWTGGKRQLLPILHPLVPMSYRRYIEPFAGGAALFFSLAPEKAVIGDINETLMLTYKVIRDECEDLLQHLSVHQNQEAYYYAVRDLDRLPLYDRMSNVEKASRFLFLNKTGYGGLYRINKKGQVNVPFGRYKKVNIVNEKVIRKASEYLNGEHISLMKADFLTTAEQAKEGDFVYLDPPYYFGSDRNFAAYAPRFTLYDHIRLKRMFSQLNDRGCYVVLSNSDTQAIRELYNEFHIQPVEVTRLVNRDTNKRKGSGELLIMNDRLWREKQTESSCVDE
ncbi:DNA adenine methylase [Bacillus sp. JCM 19041]|uniref:DNA adenine methylase n=1 Tax=Bacillus sp. JCM 19041 TaxID=1460637 RepID=UPI0006D02854